jgi:hypothetical protein
MAGKDECIRFEVDPAIFDGGLRPTSATAAVRQDRDLSFVISGGVSYPASTVPAASGSAPPPADVQSTETVAQSRPTPRKARREPLVHIALRIPRKTLDEIDALARDQNNSGSAIIREILVNAVRKRRARYEARSNQVAADRDHRGRDNQISGERLTAKTR